MQELVDLLRPAPGERWAALPSSLDPRQLVPLHRKAGPAAVRDRARDRTAPGRVASQALAAILGTGAGTRLLRSRTVTSTAEAGPSLTSWLEGLLGQRRLLVAVGLGPPRPNRKPVLHVLDRCGRTVCFGKLGWTDLSRRLVAHEADFLAALGGRLGQTVVLPEVLARADWHGLNVVLTRPLPIGRRRGRRPLPITAALLRDIAGPLTGADAWARSVVERAGPAVPEAVTAAAERVAASRPLAGRWHGDLTPWNAHPSGGRFLVWDWERTATPVPLGVDAVHAAYQVARLRRGLDVAASAVASEGEAAPVLHELGVDPRLVVDAYLVELFLRHVEDGANDGSIAAFLARR